MNKTITILLIITLLTSCNSEVKESTEIVSNYADSLEGSITDARNVVDKINTNQAEEFYYNQKYSRQIDVENFKNKLETGEYILIDVRTPGELVEFGKISDNQILININNPNFEKEVSKLDKNKKYLIYCWHGSRSNIARQIMEKKGFLYLEDLKGGINAWKNK